MVRGGGLCVAEPPGSPLNRVSPRIRALQDRLLDSLPADGAWECLSPAQREAIISLHNVRITRIIDSRGRSPERVKKSVTNGNKNFISKGINKYGRCRSYEDKLESETDDSGVRLLSGETNSSSTSNSHSHEDDSSDPGVKREGGRFAKSPRVDRAILKDGKTPYDVSKRTNVPNGIGNVNKIISKQQSRNPPPQSIACKATMDCRNIMGVKHRTRVSNSNFIFESEQQQQMQRMVFPDCDKLKTCDQFQKSEQISRKNILERYRDPKSREIQNKNRLIVEKYDNKNNFQNDKSRLEYDVESDQTPRSDRTSPSFAEENSCFRRVNNNNRFSRSRRIDDNIQIDAFEVDDELFERKEERKDKDSGLDMSSGKANKALLNSGYDYRTHLNLDAFDKYSSNWNSIILNRSSDVPMRVVCYQDKHLSKIHPNPPARASRQFSPMNRYSNPVAKSGFNHLRQEQSSYPDRNVGKKYVRSKSLDRKYLDDSSDDESDFEVRRRTERMRRYAKANQDWGLHKQSPNDRRNMEVASRPKAKSNIDLSRINPSSEDFDDTGDNCFQSRSNILNKWKSEDFDLSSKPHEDREFHEDFDRSRWRRRSCDFELEMSDGETKKRMKEADRRKWQRRSCDFELEGDQDDFLEKWDTTVKDEMRVVKERKMQTHKKELRPIYPTNIKRMEPALGKCHPMRENATPPLKIPRKKYLKEKEAMISAMPESRIFSPNEDIKGYPRYSIPPGHLIETKQMKCPGVPNGKNKTANAFKGKLRIFKAILSF